MRKMKAVQVSRAGGDLEVLERDIPETRQSGFEFRYAVYATVMYSQKKACFPGFHILASLGRGRLRRRRGRPRRDGVGRG
jgi:hypothetical protein